MAKKTPRGNLFPVYVRYAQKNTGVLSRFDVGPVGISIFQVYHVIVLYRRRIYFTVMMLLFLHGICVVVFS